MADPGAPRGNQNAVKGTEWRDAIRYELARLGRQVEGDDPAYRKGLRQCAQEFIKAAKAGEMWALKELGDRTDGKASQSVELSGPDGGPVAILPFQFTDAKDPSATE